MRSVVVVDVKEGENHKATARYRREVLGQRVITLDPYRLVTQTPDGMNPVDAVPIDCTDVVPECRNLAHPLFLTDAGQDGGNTRHFLANGEECLTAALVCTALEGRRPRRSFVQAFAMLRDKEAFDALAKHLAAHRDPMVAQLGRSVGNILGNERSSTMTTIAQKTSYALGAAVSESLSDSTFDLDVINREPVSIFLVLPASRPELKPLLRQWLSSLIRARMRRGLGEHLPIQFLIDEAAWCGNMPELVTLLTVGRGFGLSAALVYQNEEQLAECFPTDKGGVVKANTARAYFSVRTNDTANSVALACGSYTGLLESGGMNAGSSHQTTGQGQSASLSSGASDNWAWHERKLLRPEQVQALDPRVAIVFAPGLRPAWTWLYRQYEHRPRSPPPWWRAVYHLLLGAGMAGLLGLVAKTLTDVTHRPKEPTHGHRPRAGTPAAREQLPAPGPDGDPGGRPRGRRQGLG